MVENFTGIVLRTLKYSDSLMIADIFTATRGRLSFLVPVTRSKSSKVRSVLFQPLAMLTFKANYRPGRGLTRVGEVLPYVMYSSIPYEPCKSAVALYLSEFLTRALHEESDNGSLFTFLEYSLRWFDEVQEGYANFHLVFLMRLTRFLGISPNLEDAARNHYFDLAAGCFSAVQPLHGNFIPAAQAVELFSLLFSDYEEAVLFTMNRQRRGEILDFLQRYYRLHIPDFPELKSAEVLKELFD